MTAQDIPAVPKQDLSRHRPGYGCPMVSGIAEERQTMNTDTQDYLIMKLRTLAHLRGATPAEIQRSVLALESITEAPSLREQYLPEPDFTA